MNMEMKNGNKTRIFRQIFAEGQLSRRDIAEKLNLSLPTVNQYLSELIEEGLVCENGMVGNTGGRRAALYSCVTMARTAIGVDITRHHITAVAVDMMGKIIGMERRKENFERSDDYNRKLGDVVESLIDQYNICRDKVLGVGLGVPGLITRDNRRIFYGEILKFTDATVEEFSKYIRYPTWLYNDAKAACFAETWLNNDLENVFYILLSNNVGGAVKINNTMYAGDNLHGCEIGHIPIHPDGKMCYCGQRGCVDAYCSASVLYEISGGDLQHFFEMLDAGEECALMRWEEYSDDLACAVKVIRTLFDCKIILGGYVGGYMERYIDDFKEKLRKITTFDVDAEYLDVCRYKVESIAAGAALNFISEFISSI